MTLSKSVRIGVDVGGTNTDAVAIDVGLAAQGDAQRGVLAFKKTPTTPDATAGIETAVRAVIESGNIVPQRIASITVGTTHFINAVVERDARRLQKVGVLRLSRSFLREVPPFSDFPPDLAAIIKGYCGIIDGGLHIDGSQEAPIKEAQVIAECEKIKAENLKAIVIAGVFSPIDEVFKQESRVRDIILREIPGIDVVCSHEVANIGFLERENASILNAAILQYARKTMRRFNQAKKKLNLTCPLFITQNDGTTLDAAAAARIPIRTFASGATNSMRGAAYLAGIDAGGNSSAIVVDIGGTTADIGVILPSGLPRQASAYVTVAGVRVNYSMPHLHSVGLGGGSLVHSVDGKVKVGPESVGHYLVEEALVFGGNTCTASDIAVALGRADMGDKGRLAELKPEFVHSAKDCIKTLLDGAVDVIKTSADPLPVLLVGGGAVLAPEDISGASKVILPPFHDVANAIGAAISRVSGDVDIVQSTAHQSESQALERAKTMAVERAIQAGAIPESITMANVESIPLQYVSHQVRTIVKAVGDVDFKGYVSELELEAVDDDDEISDEPEGQKNRAVKTTEHMPVDPFAYTPTIKVNDEGIPEWILNETDLAWLADGCYVLGCAGGGTPAPSFIQLRDIIRQGHTIRIIDQSSLKDDALIYWGGHMGSPAVSVERLQSTETVEAFDVLMEYLGHKSIDAVMGLEIGGANGMEPMLVGSSRFFNAPVIDGDWMGRAYPTYWQTTLAVHKPLELVPCAIDSGDGKSIIMTRAPDDEIVDRALRASCSEMGSRVGMAAKPTTTEYVRSYGVLNTCSLAWRIGRCIARSVYSNQLSTVAESIIEEAGGLKSARVLFRGKIVEVERRLYKGHSHGALRIEAFDEHVDEDGGSERMTPVVSGGTLRIPFKNENILAEHTSADGSETKIIASVPDLIAVLDNGSGKALGVPEFKYGYRVTVLGITCSPQWTRTPSGIEIGGPKAFGYDDVVYKPLGEYVEPLVIPRPKESQSMAQANNILVVGGTGTIGGYIALEAHSRGYAVTISGRKPVKDVPILSDLPFIQVDYTTAKYNSEMLSAFDSVVFSAGADMRHVPENTSADEYYLQSAASAIAFARRARDAGVKRFVHIGSFYWHIAPELVEKTPYIRSRKIAAEGIASLSRPGFHACSLDAPWVVGAVPGLHSPIFAAYVQFAEGKLGMGPSVIDANSNFVSIRALATAAVAALERSESVTGRTVLIGGENMTFAEFFSLVFSAVGNDVPVSVTDQEHPLVPESALWAGRSIKVYEPDAEEEALLGGYRRYSVQDAVEQLVEEYRSS
ncbi:d-amino acid hydantoin hydrolase (hydantoinase) [Fusarium sp. NRRL 25303]|nr:d-amino acid hydantoin hydrolase (hydantoinase) [Fusarium sp. NRRL 25303]